MSKNFHDLSALDIDQKMLSFSKFKGKKVLVVNVASKCGFTPQYKDLQELYLKYKDTGFEIIGFPANNFLWQEPGSDADIKEFCSLNYQVTFPMMSKISVKGRNQHEVYKWLTKKEDNGVMDSKVKWNFQKYLIGEAGELLAAFSSKESPTSSEIVKWINKK